MEEFKFTELVDKLSTEFTKIINLNPEDRLITPTTNNLLGVKNILNEMFSKNEENKNYRKVCEAIYYTLNTDKPFFGVRVNPQITPAQAVSIFTSEDDVFINNYQLEFDSKLFDMGLTGDEITSIVIFEITSMIGNDTAIKDTRAMIDLYVLQNDTTVNIRNSINYNQLLVYAAKDTMYKVSSIMFKEDTDEIMNNPFIVKADLADSLIAAQQKIDTAANGIGDTVRDPKTIILQWMFTMYNDMKKNSYIMRDTLSEAKLFTGSKLDKDEIDKVIAAIDRIQSNTLTESCTLDKAIYTSNLHSLNEISIFKSLKQNGLRSIEDALYEYKIRVKNCDTEEDTMYILRGINTRLGVLEDYLYNTPDIKDTDRKHWEAVAKEYRDLRETLGKKKIGKNKNYGLFFDYDQLDAATSDED